MAATFGMAALCTGVCAFVPALRLPARVHVGQIRVFEKRTFLLPVRNTSLWFETRIERVHASCGCTSVESTAPVIPPRSATNLTVTVEPGIWDRHLHSTVSVGSMFGKTAQTIITGDVLIPFDGWPDRMVAYRDSRGYWRADLAPAYRGVVTAGSVQGTDGSISPCVVDEASGEVLLFFDGHRQAGDGLQVLLAFDESGIENWRGWLVFR
jgi:hypothetical protein